MKATKFSQFLQSREELKFVDTPHWIYVIEAALFSAFVLIAAFWGSSFMTANAGQFGGGGVDSVMATLIGYSTLILQWGAIIFVLFYFINRVIYYLTTYVFASDRRLYLKTGLLRVIVKEISFDEIRATDINYGLFGRLLGYGKLIMDARFVEDANLPYTYFPETFAKLIHYDNDLVDDVNLSFALQEMKSHKENEIPKSYEGDKTIPPQHDQIDDFQQQKDYQKDDANDGELDVSYLMNTDADSQQNFDDVVSEGHRHTRHHGEDSVTRENNDETNHIPNDDDDSPSTDKQRPSSRHVSRTTI